MKYSFALLLFLCFASLAQAYTISGDCVSYENGYGKITQCPHTLTDFTNTVYLNITSNITGTINIDSAFGFDTSIIKPSSASYFAPNVAHTIPTVGPILQTVTCNGFLAGIVNETHVWCLNLTAQNQTFYCPTPRFFPNTKTCQYNHTELNGTEIVYFDDWSDISNLFAQRAYAGKTYYIVENVSFTKGQTRQLKIMVQVQPNQKGKYDLLMKRSVDSWGDVISGLVPGVILDPWFDTSFQYMTYLNFSCPDGGICDNDIATPVLITNALILSHMNTSTGGDLRYLVNCSGVNTQRGIWIQNISASNVSLWVNYTNQTGCSHHLYYGKPSASSASNPYNVFLLWDDFQSSTYDVTKWTGWAISPNQLGNGWVEHNFVDNKFITYTANNVPGNSTTYFEQRQRTTVGKSTQFCTSWSGGAMTNCYSINAIGFAAPFYTVNSYNKPGLFNGSLVTILDENYLIQLVNIRGGTDIYNFSRQQVPVESLGSPTWTPINQTSRYGAETDTKIVLCGVGAVAGNNVSIFWAGITNGVRTPFIPTTSYWLEENVSNSSSNSTTSTLAVLAFDEISNARIYFNINLANSSTSNSFSYQYTFNQTQSAFPSGALTLSITNVSEYYPRTYYHTVNPLLNETVSTYLLPLNASTKSVTFYVQTATSVPIVGATVTIGRIINGTMTIVGEMVTDGVGTAHFYMDSTNNYQIIASASGYTTYTTAITPSETSYIIYLSTGGTSSGNYTSAFYDVQWSFVPLGRLNCNYTQNFSFASYSNGGRILWTYWAIYNYSTLLNWSNATGTHGTTLSYSFKPGNNASIIIYFYIASNQSNSTALAYWANSIPLFCPYNWNYSSFQETLKDIGKPGGLGNMTIALIVIFVGVMVAGWVGQFSQTGGTLAFLAILGLGMYISGTSVFISGLIVMVAILIVGAYYLWRSGG